MINSFQTRSILNSMKKFNDNNLSNQFLNSDLSITQLFESGLYFKSSDKQINEIKKLNQLSLNDDNRIYQRSIIPTDPNGQPLQASSKAQRLLKTNSIKLTINPELNQKTNEQEQKPFGFMKDHAFQINDYYGFGSLIKKINH